MSREEQLAVLAARGTTDGERDAQVAAARRAARATAAYATALRSVVPETVRRPDAEQEFAVDWAR